MNSGETRSMIIEFGCTVIRKESLQGVGWRIKRTEPKVSGEETLHEAEGENAGPRVDISGMLWSENGRNLRNWSIN